MNGFCPCASSPLNQTLSPMIQPPTSIQSWYDFDNLPPKNPRDLIAWANITGATPAFSLSSNYATGPWISSPISIGAILPACIALGSDNLQNVADAQQWNSDHLTAKTDTNLAIPLRKRIFLRGGTQWKMQISLNLGPATYNDLQLSFLDNAATRGDAQGTIPVVAFTGGNLTGNIVLEVVLKIFGQYTMGLRAYDGTNRSMYEMEWAVVK